MNLEYDQDELHLLHNGRAVLEKIAPIPVNGTDRPAERWTGLVDAGWDNLGAELDDGALSLSVAVDLFRRAGAQLLIEDLVTSAHVLSSVATGIEDPTERQEIAARLRARRGLLLGDGTSRFLPLVGEDESRGLSFGTAGDCDIYRLVPRRSGFVLQWWDGSPPALRPLGNLSLSITEVALDTLGSWRSAPLRWDAEHLEALERGAMLLHAASLVGCGERLLELSCSHANQRVQFGAPIGSFQALKHLLADVHTGLTVAWNSILSATAEGADTAIAPLVARYLAVDAALAAARVGAQVHGGMGFTAELNVHLFLKAILDGSMRGGTPDDVAAALGRRFAEASC